LGRLARGRRVVKVHRLVREQWIPAPADRIFAFFSDAYELEGITPPWVDFAIRTPRPIALEKDATIEYVLRLAGVPFSWQTRIASWDPPRSFVDVQERGPYALWEHTHRFVPCGDGVRMEDDVRYALPFAPVGELAHWAVRASLAAIFDFRFDAIRARFGGGGTP
jgi:ligand-binding SRPBCC domain-containing protein